MSAEGNKPDTDPMANLMTPEGTKPPATIDTSPGSSGLLANLSSSWRTSHLIKVILGVLLFLIILFVILMAVYSSQRSTQQQKNNEKRTQNNDIRSRNSGLNETLRSRERQVQELKVKISANDDAIKKLQTELATVTQQRDGLLQQIKDIDAKIKEQEDTINSLNSQINDKNRQIEEANHTIQQLQHDIQTKTAELAKLHTERLWYQIGDGVSVLGNLGFGIYSWVTHSSLTTARNESTVLKAKLTHLRSEVEALQKLLIERLGKLQELNATNQTQTKQIASLNTQLKALNDEIIDLHNKLVDLVAKYDQLYDKYENLLKQYNELKQKKDELQAQYNKLDGDYKALMAAYTELEGKFNQLNATYQKLAQDYADLHKYYQDLLSKNGTLAEKYTKLLSDYATLLQVNKTLTEFYNNLLKRYGELQANLTRLEGELRNLKAKYDELEKNMATLLEQIAQLKTEIAHVTGDIQHLKVEYDNLLKTIDEIQAHLFTHTLDKFYLHLLPAAHNMKINEVLLYNSAVDGFSNEAFKQKVGNNGALLFMMKSEKNRYFGGFINKTIVYDIGPVHDPAAFTFSRNHSEVCYLQEEKVAYFNTDGYLFVFGDHEIMIHNQTDPTQLHTRTRVDLHPNESYVIPSRYDKYEFYEDAHEVNLTSLEVYRLDVIKT